MMVFHQKGEQHSSEPATILAKGPMPGRIAPGAEHSAAGLIGRPADNHPGRRSICRRMESVNVLPLFPQ
jgi:hypothetical protein